jgi:hypothetical protein
LRLACAAPALIVATCRLSHMDGRRTSYCCTLLSHSPVEAWLARSVCPATPCHSSRTGEPSLRALSASRATVHSSSYSTHKCNIRRN